MPIPERCCTERRDRCISLGERGRTIVFLNDRQHVVTVVQVDGCAIADESPRCDVLVRHAERGDHFVEFKGGDVVRACEQLEHSIRRLSSDPRHAPKHCFVICARVSPSLSPAIQSAKHRFRKAYQAELVVRSGGHRHRLS